MSVIYFNPQIRSCGGFINYWIHSYHAWTFAFLSSIIDSILFIWLSKHYTTKLYTGLQILFCTLESIYRLLRFLELETTSESFCFLVWSIKDLQNPYCVSDHNPGTNKYFMPFLLGTILVFSKNETSPLEKEAGWYIILLESYQ